MKQKIMFVEDEGIIAKDIQTTLQSLGYDVPLTVDTGEEAIKKANQTKGVPSIIIARTIKGKGVEHMEDNPQWHGKAPKPEMVPIINSELESQFMIAHSIIAGNKLSKRQVNFLFVFFNIPSVIYSSPTPASLSASTSASSFSSVNM